MVSTPNFNRWLVEEDFVGMQMVVQTGSDFSPVA